MCTSAWLAQPPTQRWAGLTVAVIVACATLSGSGTGCARPGLVSPEIAQRPWLELRSVNFLLTTDLPEKEALARFRKLEEQRWALFDAYSLIAPSQPPVTGAFAVVHFADCADFRAIAPKNAGGFVVPSIDFQSRRTMVTCEGVRNLDEILVHELSHVLTNALMPPVPTWFNEGLATYFQTVHVDDGKLTIGSIPKMDSEHGRQVNNISLDELLGGDFRRRGERRNYRAAWTLIHLLNSKSGYQELFRQYVASVRGGTPLPAAWEQTLGTIDRRKLEKEYKTYLNSFDLRGYAIAYEQTRAIARPTTRTLRVGEAHAIWVQRLLLRGNFDEAAAHVDLIDKHDSEWAGRLVWRGVVQRMTVLNSAGKAVEDNSSALFRRYAQLEPRDNRGWRLLIRAHYRKLVPKDWTIGMEIPGLAAMEADVKGLMQATKTSSDLNTIAWYYALRRQPKIGLNFAKRALARNPSCGDCYDTLALLQYYDGQLPAAVRSQVRAIGMSSHNPANVREMATRLSVYEAAAQAPAL